MWMYVFTFLSVPHPPSPQHGITCIGFHDAGERQQYVCHLDRVMKLQQDKALRLRARVDSETKQLQRPTEYVIQSSLRVALGKTVLFAGSRANQK